MRMISRSIDAVAHGDVNSHRESSSLWEQLSSEVN